MEKEEKLRLLIPFFNEIENIQPLPANVRDHLSDKFCVKRIDKETILLSEGEICKYLWVVLEGVVRSFHYVGETEVTSRLMQPYHIIISVESFYTQTPAFETLETIQPCVLAYMHYDELETVYKLFPELNFTGRRLTEHYLFLTERRLHLLRKQKASDKYKMFLEEYPQLVNKIPLKYIASYLGINQETLSRVRNKLR